MVDIKTTPDINPFRTENVTLSNGKIFGIPADAIPQIRDISKAYKEMALREEENPTDHWKTFQHTIGIAVQALYIAAYLDSNSQEQQEKLVSETKKILVKEGPEIAPLLRELGFPDVSQT